MRHLFHRLLLAPAALVVVLATILGFLGTFGATPAQGATTTAKSKVISTVSAITADTTDCDETAGYYEVPRGATRISFTFLATVNTDYAAGSVYFKGYIVGCDTPNGTYTRIAGLATGELVVNVAQEVPAANDAAGTTLPRFIKVEWDETGTHGGLTATCRIRYHLAEGPGRQYAADYLGG